MVLGIAFNLGLLGWFKYSAFFVDNINAVAGTSFSLGTIILPLAISFFTFQQIAYLIDVYRGLVVETGLLRYCLFVTFFPQLIAGPIVHHSEMLPQFARRVGSGFSSRHFAVGVTIFTIGLIKKLAIADPLGHHADRVFEIAAYGDPLTFVSAWYGTVAFGLQIYFDFSGYSDMAIGLARMFGVRLPLNFDSPYKAVNIIEFWRRWHMTLSRFLRDHLYIPLGGNRRGRLRRHANLMSVMLLGGLWHGASWNFVIWGGLHGLFLLVNHAWRGLRGALGWSGDGSTALGRGLSWALTLFAVFFAWAFFRAQGWDAAMVIIDGLTGRAGVIIPDSYSVRLGPLVPLLADLGVQFGVEPDAAVYPTRGDLGQIVLVLMIVLAAPNTQQLMAETEPALGYRATDGRPAAALFRWRPDAVTGAFTAAACFCGLVLLFRQASNAFIYFQF